MRHKKEHSEPFSFQAQHELYQYAVDAMQGGSVTLRTLDVGGDKPLAFVKIGAEENPIMGLRGVRNYFNNSEVSMKSYFQKMGENLYKFLPR